MTKVPSLDYWRRFIEVTRVNGKGTFTKIFGEGIVDDEGTPRLMTRVPSPKYLEKVLLVLSLLTTKVHRG